jgi:hypothetical protein
LADDAERQKPPRGASAERKPNCRAYGGRLRLRGGFRGPVAVARSRE